MTVDRDRRAALDFARKNADNWTSDDIDNLAAFRATARAEGAAEALRNVANEIDWHFPVPGIHLSPEDGWVCAALNAALRARRNADRIRALAPADAEVRRVDGRQG